MDKPTPGRITDLGPDTRTGIPLTTAELLEAARAVQSRGESLPGWDIVYVDAGVYRALVATHDAALAFVDWVDTEPGLGYPLRFTDPEGNRTLDELVAAARKLPSRKG